MKDLLKGNQEIIHWLNTRSNKTNVNIQPSTFSKLEKWYSDSNTGDIKHDSGKFFSIIGVDVKTNMGQVNHWSQPIINQDKCLFAIRTNKKISFFVFF